MLYKRTVDMLEQGTGNIQNPHNLFKRGQVMQYMYVLYDLPAWKDPGKMEHRQEPIFPRQILPQTESKNNLIITLHWKYSKLHNTLHGKYKKIAWDTAQKIKQIAPETALKK